jgi:hypothetical protein
MLLVLAAALSAGVAVVLQTQAARLEPNGRDALILVSLLRRPRYVLALTLVALSFGCGALALRAMPVFQVQAGRASSLAVTAALSVPLLGARLGRRDVAALAAVGVGLVLLAGAAQPGAAQPALGAQWVAPAAVLIIWAVGPLTGRITPLARSGLAAAVVAGLGFAVLAVAVRSVITLPVEQLVSQPTTWAGVAAGAAGLHFGALALRKAPVVSATATMVGVESVVGAVAGVLWTGDGARVAAAPSAVSGFVLVLAGALSLARFGQPDAGPGVPTSADA